jgi:1-acyl-sn-glycerol-3-phosphate acyltransferase
MVVLRALSRLIINILFHIRFDLKYTYDQFDPKTTKPYILIGNHVTQHDPLIIGMKIKRYPYPVANSFLYTSKIQKFLLTKVIYSISKRKGQSDSQTILKILRAVKQEKRGVMLFPEGNASYFGKESPVLYEATAKLLKKLDVDVVFAKIRGGYLSHPRWGSYRKKGHFHVHMYQLCDQQALQDMSLDDLIKKLKEAFVFNDYEWNRLFKHAYPLKGSQQGIEHYLYYCPKCHQHQTLYGKDADILCHTCGKIASMDTYMQMTGPFHSIIEWDKEQKLHLKDILKHTITTEGLIYDTDLIKQKRRSLGHQKVYIDLETLTIGSHTRPIVLHINQIQNLVITQKNRVSFDYLDKTYNMLLKDPMLCLDSIQYIQGESYGTMVHD